jgi:hypothetical protein
MRDGWRSGLGGCGERGLAPPVSEDSNEKELHISTTTSRAAAGAALAFLAGAALYAGTAHAASPASGEIRGYAAKCADDSGDSAAPRTRIQVWSCTGRAAQQWSFGGGELHHAGMCMNAKGGGTSGNPVILWPCNGAANETWDYHGATGEYVLKAGGLCLDDPAFSSRNGTQLIVYRCNGGANQRWSLAPMPQLTPSSTPTPPAPPPGCHPLTSAGNCYEPGEFCPAADHGMTGVAGDGEAITCEDVNGWRWEPA